MVERVPVSEIRSASEPDLHDPAVRLSLARYWKATIRLTACLLGVWFLVGPGCGILIADWLNQFRVPGTGYPLGFWFAQQGSILTFVVLIGIYCFAMNRLDARHHAELQALRSGIDRKEGQ